MGKQTVNMLLSVTMLFCTFLSGFFFGRYYNDSPVQVSHLPVQTQSADAPQNTNPTLPTETPTTQVAATDPSGLININTATAEQLEMLPGIGEVIARRIIDYRNTHGPFQSVYALTNVKGIGEKRLADLLHLITV